MISRQREWQLRKAAKGLCISCGERALKGNERCFRHYVLRQFARVELPARGNVAARDYLISWLRGRYIAIKMEGEDGRLERDARAAWERRPFNRSRHGADRFVRVAQAVERLAQKEK